MLKRYMLGLLLLLALGGLVALASLRAFPSQETEELQPLVLDYSSQEASSSPADPSQGSPENFPAPEQASQQDPSLPGQAVEAPSQAEAQLPAEAPAPAQEVIPAQQPASPAPATQAVPATPAPVQVPAPVQAPVQQDPYQAEDLDDDPDDDLDQDSDDDEE